MNQVDDNGCEQSGTVASKIEQLENWFDKLRTQIICELSAKCDMTVKILIDTLTSLPLSLKREYESSITKRVPDMRKEEQVGDLFFHLNPLVSFIDYSLIEHFIKKFGSDSLRKDMQSYCYDMQTFMKQTTIQQLIDCLPGKQEAPKNFTILRAKIGRNASTYTLDKINTLRKRFCAEVQLSEVVFCLIALEESNSFIISLLMPSVLVPDLIETAKEVKEGFYDMESILSLSIGDRWLYSRKLSPFSSQLKQQYQQYEGSPFPIEWIPSPTREVFRLAMIQREGVRSNHLDHKFVQMTIHGRIDDVLSTKSPVDLKDIFGKTLHGSGIILIEGAPGSGKSTLAVNICQRWGKGELFQKFTMIILLQLRDPVVQRAQTIADLLPVENGTNAREIAAELMATNGRGVLWILDGWDELPTHLQHGSLFRKLLPPKPNEEQLKKIEESPFYSEYVSRGSSKEELWLPYLQNNRQFCIEYYNKRLLNECSVIVTSRPISSCDLHLMASSRIEVLGFTPAEQRRYFSVCLKGNTNALEMLVEMIQENPVIQSICYLPLNAAFVVHSFKYLGQSLPNTEFEIYLSVIFSCIQRHFEREGKDNKLPRKLASLGDLSRNEIVREPFQNLCELAYRGVMENRVTFSSSDLPQGSNTLGILQAMEGFFQHGKSVFYNFLHLSIQEVLSGYYIATWLSDNEQVSQFQQLFNQPRFAAVFQFYAAITKLKTPGIRPVIAKVVEAKSDPLLVSLLRCLYEAQDASLCLYVAEQLKFELYLENTSLSPLDCLSISFFLSTISGKEISVDLDECYIGDHGAKCLAKHLGRNVDHVGKATIDLYCNNIHDEGASHIAGGLNYFKNFFLSCNPIGDTGVSFISEAIKESAALKTLSLNDLGITSRGAEDLSRALAQNCSLEKLDIGGNNLGDEGIGHLAEALKQNRQLKEFLISNCGITDEGAASLASALHVNNSLKMLHMSGDKGTLTEDGLSAVTQSLTYKSNFIKLVIPSQFGSGTAFQLECKVNEARMKYGLSPIEIKGYYNFTS